MSGRLLYLPRARREDDERAAELVITRPIVTIFNTSDAMLAYFSRQDGVAALIPDDHERCAPKARRRTRPSLGAAMSVSPLFFAQHSASL